MDSLQARVAGVFRRPRRTFEAIAARRGWSRDCSAVLLLTTLSVAAAGAAVFGTNVGGLALLDEWERTATAFGRPVDDTEYARLRTLSQNGAVYGIGRALALGPVALAAVAILVHAAFRRHRPETRLAQVFAVVAYSGVILAVRQLVATAAVLIRETTASATALGVWFPGIDEGSPVARLLAMLDLFVLWWLVVLAIGASVLYGVRTRRTAVALMGAYVVFAVLMAAAMAMFGGT